MIAERQISQINSLLLSVFISVFLFDILSHWGPQFTNDVPYFATLAAGIRSSGVPGVGLLLGLIWIYGNHELAIRVI